jgi:hypothetical protein
MNPDSNVQNADKLMIGYGGMLARKLGSSVRLNSKKRHNFQKSEIAPLKFIVNLSAWRAALIATVRGSTPAPFLLWKRKFSFLIGQCNFGHAFWS